MKYKGNEKEYKRIWQAQWRKNNSERVKEIRKRYYQKHREKRLEETKKWCENNPEYHKKWNRKRHQFVDDYKLLKGCKICGYNDYAVALVFHHKGDKEFNIAKNILVNLKKLKEEMDKCEILCRNCHAVLHYEERVKNG